MSPRVFVLLFIPVMNLVTLVAAHKIHSYTGVDHFREGGVVTILSGFQLIAIAVLAYMIYRKDSLVLWKIVALGFIFLAVDELFLIHERTNRIEEFFELDQNPLTRHIDDLLVGVYGVVGLVVFAIYADRLKPYKESLPYYFCGFVLFFAMVAADIITHGNDILPLVFDHDTAITLHSRLSIAEDFLKLLGEAFFLLAFYTTWQIANSMAPVLKPP